MKYKYHSAKGSETAWIESPKGGEVGDLLDIACELNDLLDAWRKKCMEADTLRQHLKIAQQVIDGDNYCDHEWAWHATGAGSGYYCAKCDSYSQHNVQAMASADEKTLPKETTL